MSRSGSPEPNGGSPVASSYSVAPSAYRSARWSTGRPVRPVCSGARYGKRPDDLAVVRELGTDLGERGRQREVHQARRPVGGQHDVRRGDVAMHHAAAVHPRHRPGQLHRQLDQLVDGQRLRQLGQARAAGVLQHDRARVRRRVHQLRDPADAAQPLEDRQFVPQPPLRVRSQRLLADDRAPGRNSRVTRVRSLAIKTSVRPGGSRSSAAPPIPIPCLPDRSHADLPHDQRAIGACAVSGGLHLGSMSSSDALRGKP